MSKPVTTLDIKHRKGGEPIAVLTAYTTPMARLLDPHADVLLVGDTLGMVVYGLPSTLGVTVEMMIAHGQAVVRGAPRACVVVDMPFGSYQASPEQAFTNAARIMAESGCAAVKLEGGVEMAATVRYLVERGIPVMGHVGMMPQRMHAYGGFRYQGRNEAEQQAIRDDAAAIDASGVFSMVIEAVPEALAAAITRAAAAPTIGIGAGAQCDGQVLVIDDMLGMSERTPKFVRRYAEVGAIVTEAAEAYVRDVKARRFPGREHTYGVGAAGGGAAGSGGASPAGLGASLPSSASGTVSRKRSSIK